MLNKNKKRPLPKERSCTLAESLSGRRSRGVDLRLGKSVGLQGNVLTLGRLIGNDPADFADSESLVITSEAVGTGTGVIDTRALSQTGTGNAAQISRGEQLPGGLVIQSSPAAGIEDVGGSSAAVSDGVIGAGEGCTELTGDDSAVILQTFAHSGNESQFRGGICTCNAAANDVAAAQAQGSAINVGGSRNFDAIGDICPDVLVEVGRGNDDVSVQEGLLSAVLTRAIRLGVVAHLVRRAQSLIAHVHVTNGLLCDPSRLEDHADRAANRLIGEGRVDTVSVLEVNGFFFVPETKNVGVVARIDLGNVKLVRVDSHC